MRWGRVAAALAMLVSLLCLTVFSVAALHQVFTAKPVNITPESRPLLEYDDFNPGYIISDANFQNWQSMGERDIQKFLDQASSICEDGPNKCFAKGTYPLPSQPTTQFCDAIKGGENLSGALIIAKVAKACHINPQVILVTLQKEQGLLTASGKNLTNSRFAAAMGYACPDGKKCNPKYAGVGKQIYYAATQFNRYQQDPDHYRFRAGQVIFIPYSVDPKCGGEKVVIQNWASAALYNYTPYQPNADALAHNFQDSCAQAGNVNFFAYYKAWFGNPK